MTQMTPNVPAPSNEAAALSQDIRAANATNESTPVAVLGTLAEFRPDPTPYDLAGLVRFVREISPDLLCLDMTLEDWQRRDFGGLPPEYRDALVPLAYQTDIVVVPIGSGPEPGSATRDDPRGATSIRSWIVNRLRGALVRLDHGTHDPASVDRGAHHFVAEFIYHLIDDVQGASVRATVVAHREALAARIADVARRDPGSRILVVVNARYCHRLRRELRRHAGVRLVSYSEL